jgi:hypothetical protein
MRLALPPVFGAALLAVLWLSGAMSAADLAHPYWQTRGTLTGGAAGMVAALALLAVARGRARRLRVLLVTGLAALGVALVVTWRAARTFIESADFEPLAGKVWFLGYHALAALIVVAVALMLAARKGGRG